MARDDGPLRAAGAVVSRRAFLLPVLAVMLAAPTPSTGQDTRDRHVVMVTPGESDGRLAATREAVAFWNQTLSDLKLRPRLLETTVLVDPPMTRALEAYTRQVWLLAGRSVPTEAQKARAGQIAKENAEGYTIDNRLAVVPR